MTGSGRVDSEEKSGGEFIYGLPSSLPAPESFTHELLCPVLPDYRHGPDWGPTKSQGS